MIDQAPTPDSLSILSMVFVFERDKKYLSNIVTSNVTDLCQSLQVFYKFALVTSCVTSVRKVVRTAVDGKMLNGHANLIARWVAHETYRCTKLVDELWDAMDVQQDAVKTQQMIDEYNRLCDWLDLIEADPEDAYLEARGIWV